MSDLWGEGPSSTPSVTSAPPTVSPLPDLPVPKGIDNSPEAQYEAMGQNWVWDKLGRFVAGGNIVDEKGSHGNLIADIPGLGDLFRLPGNAYNDLLAKPMGVGVGTFISAASEVAGRLPPVSGLADYNIGDPLSSKIDYADTGKYPASPEGAVRLIEDVTKENQAGADNLGAQFVTLAKWQKQNDPEAFKAAMEAYDRMNKDPMKAGEIMSSYMREWGVAYNDLTPDGVTGLLDVAPELSFGGAGSFGQGFADWFAVMMVAQKKAERGAAALVGNRSGLTGPEFAVHLVNPDQPDMGSRINQLLFLADTDPKQLTDIEAAAVNGMKELGWTATHAQNFLITKGQGFSSDTLSQTTLSLALDPMFVASLGATSGAMVGTKADAVYKAIKNGSRSAASANRTTSLYQGMKTALGTTVAETRAGPLGGVYKAARFVADPFSTFGGDAHGVAKTDVYTAVGIEGTTRGMGYGAFSNANRWAKTWGVIERFNDAYGVTAMNFARKFVAKTHIDSLMAAGNTAARRVIPNEVVDALGQNMPKNVASQLADFVYRKRAYYLTDVGVDMLSERIAKAMRVPLDRVKEAVNTMDRADMALWHATTYSQAWSDFKTAVSAVAPGMWGKIEARLDDMVLLNPDNLDNVAAQSLLHEMQAAKTFEEKVVLWNTAAGKYEKIEALGKVKTGGEHEIERRISALNTMVSRGELHTALDIRQIKSLPQSFKDDFLNTWVDSQGQPMWRLGFKPKAEWASGLSYDETGALVAKYEPSVDNVARAIPVGTKRYQPLTDFLGRKVGETAAGQAIGKAMDSVDVVVKTAMDGVSGERLMASMEQRYISSMRKAGYSQQVSRRTFKMVREYSQEHGFTLAGLSPDDFWRATEPELKGLVDESIAKRDVFNMLADAADGDLRLIGLSSGLAQRIRSAAAAKGLPGAENLTHVTTKTYNWMRYVLNPTFIVQLYTDAPWFNMLRGVTFDMMGKAAEPGSPMYRTQQIVQAMGHTGLVRDLAMDQAEYVKVVGWQQNVANNLGAMPGVRETISDRLKHWSGRMVLNNEMLNINSELGRVFEDALTSTRQIIDDHIANATTAEEKAAWGAARDDHAPMLDWLQKDFTRRMGHAPSANELAADYISQMVDDSRLVIRNAQGLLDHTQALSKGVYHTPASVGELLPMDLRYGVESLMIPNVHTVADLRGALDDEARHLTIADIGDQMLEMGYHPDAVKRFKTAVTFNWRTYFDDAAQELGMTRPEMLGIEDMFQRAAKDAGMDPLDYVTQVRSMTERQGAREARATARGQNVRGSYTADLDLDLAYTLKVFRLAQKGEAGVEELTRLVTANLQPSMKRSLLDTFSERITGRNGLIEKAQAKHAAAKTPAEKAAAAQDMADLNKIAEAFAGGGDAYDVAFDAMYRDMVIDYASGRAPRGAPVEPMVIPDASARTFGFRNADDHPFVKAAPPDPTRQWAYHITPGANVDRIRAEGLVPGSDGTFFASDAVVASYLVPEGNVSDSMILRIRNDPPLPLSGELDSPRTGAAEYLSHDTFSPDRIEFYGADEQWHQITRPPLNAEAERAARYFARWLESMGPNIKAGETLKGIVDNIPVEGASAYNMTEAMLVGTLHQSIRTLEKDAIRLADMSTERNVLNRSLNHPFFAMYPTSYFWGKVLPETAKFIAYEPFGVRTTAGLQTYFKVKQSIALQSQYDDRMSALYDDLGKSAVMGLISYLSPAMPWEDMTTMLPPWVRSLSKDGDFEKALQAEWNTFSPERWVSRFMEAGDEIKTNTIDPVVESLQQVTTAPAEPTVPAAPQSTSGATNAVDLGPVLSEEWSDLQRALSGN